MLYSFFDDESLSRHQLMISRKTQKRVVSILYRKQHYAPITKIPPLFADMPKRYFQKYIYIRCLGHFILENIIARHKQFSSRDDFISVLPVLPVPGEKLEQTKFNQYNYCPKARFVSKRALILPVSRSVVR